MPRGKPDGALVLDDKLRGWRTARDAPKSRVAVRPMWLGSYPISTIDAVGKIIGMQGIIPIDSFSAKAVTLTIEYGVNFWLSKTPVGGRCGVGSDAGDLLGEDPANIAL